MALVFHTAEGHADGDIVKKSNSPGLEDGSEVGGTQFDVVLTNNVSNPFGSDAITYSADAALQGDLGFKLHATTGTTQLRHNLPAPANRGVARRPVKPGTSAAPGVTVRPSSGYLQLLQLRGVGDAFQADLVLTPTKIAVRITGWNQTAIEASGFTFTAGVQYWCELAVTPGTTTSNGKVELWVFAADGTTQLFYNELTGLNASTVQCERVRWGGIPLGDDYFDSIQFSDKATGFNGPLAGQPVVLDEIPATSGEGGDVIQLSTTGAPTPSSWTWRQISGPTASTSQSGGTLSVTVPDLTVQNAAPMVFGVVGHRDGVSSDEVQAVIVPLPVLLWSRVHGQGWVNGRLKTNA